jgi:hypothetical protein
LKGAGGISFFLPPCVYAMFDTRSSNPSFGFVKQRPTVLDELPLDIIRVYIFPKLDYESRINLNLCLPPWDRLSKKMNRASMEIHDRITTVPEIKKYLDKLNNHIWGNTERFKLIIQMFCLICRPRYINMTQYNFNFRQTLFDRLEHFKEEAPMAKVDINLKVRLVKVMKRLKNKLMNNPYKSQEAYFVEPLVFV